MPIMLDVGTENVSLLNDPLYNGLEQHRIRGEKYDAFIDEFVEAVQEVFPGVLIQFEDFGNQNAFRLLKKYRDKANCFNDDIQGTGAVALSGIIASLRITGGKLSEQRLLFLGAGEAGIGTANTFVAALAEEGISAEEARKQQTMLVCRYAGSAGRRPRINRSPETALCQGAATHRHFPGGNPDPETHGDSGSVRPARQFFKRSC